MVTDEGDEIAQFCETHWQELKRKLSRLGREYQAAIRAGEHPRMLQRRMSEQIANK